ncbi:hypothetical protein [Spirosoma rhododendri]|uniref:Methyltransferase FkbM domain-containing protein n=1 Tax=Spirosoma rhododendri TaxID=2728024 RepID=A0A7L5DSW9_9BACT|nr:hypothetical protein [Spirosoma rhododendri]QJD81564.1 hypothetical protein HH216_24670 [Spirosoma rhododendri]
MKILNDIIKQNIGKMYSAYDEQKVILTYLTKIQHKKIVVDIAAQDGVNMSNTYSLYRAGYSGLAVECNSKFFASLAKSYKRLDQVMLSKLYVYPENVVQLLEAYQIPYDFGFLNFDIDGYDHFVLNQLLTQYRPSLICVEINEKIPYPIKFTVKYSRDYVWDRSHFYGQSIAQLYILCERYNYDLVELHYNNAFLIPAEQNKLFPSLQPGEAYKKGYKCQPDRTQKFPWNKDMDAALDLSPDKALAFINDYFSKYEGQYEVSI